MNTPDKIIDLRSNEVIVVGTNTQGRHGMGLAYFCKKKFGLVQGVSMGLCGQSYGIITKELDSNVSMLSTEQMLKFIGDQVYVFYKFASLRKDLIFYVSKIGTGLAGFNVEEMKIEVFQRYSFIKPFNVILPKEFEL